MMKLHPKLLAILLTVSVTASSVPAVADEVCAGSDFITLSVSENDYADNASDAFAAEENTEDVYRFPTLPYTISIEEYNRQMQEVIDEVNGESFNDSELSIETAANLPASYDPRTVGSVTSVKDQGNVGICWAFAAMAVSESALIRQGFENSSVDLSELHATYFSWKKYGSGYTFKDFCYAGGNEGYPIAIMHSGAGPVYEKDCPAASAAVIPTSTVDESMASSHIYELKRVESTFITSDADNIAAVKNLITTYGGTTLGYYADTRDNMYTKWAANSSEDMTYYLPYRVGLNHAVEIVGWDDNYPASDFLKTPPGNGAWLIKNSWGTGGIAGSGYMWISYYDMSFQGERVACPVFAKNGTTPRSVSLNLTAADLNAGDTLQLTQTVSPSNVANKSVTWSSSDETVASVSDTGMVTALKNGDCEITVRTVEGEQTAVCSINVTTKAKDLLLTDARANSTLDTDRYDDEMILSIESGYDHAPRLNVNFDPDTTSDKSWEFTCDNPKVIETNRPTLYEKLASYICITALDIGEANITVRSLDGSNLSKTIKVIVKQTVSSDPQPTPQPDPTPDPIVDPIVDPTPQPQPSPQPTQPVAPAYDCNVSGHQLVETVVEKATTASSGMIESKCKCCTHRSVENIKPCKVTYDKEVTYNGKAQKAKLCVEDGAGNNITSKCQITYKNNTRVGRATVLVTYKTDRYHISQKYGFDIIPKKTVLKKVTSGDKKMTVTWKKQTTQTDGYEVQYSTNKNFGSKKVVIVSDPKKVSTQISNLQKGKTYYVRVRTYSGKKKAGRLYSAYSAVKSVKIK